MSATRIIPRLYSLLGVGRWLQTPAVERLYLAAFFAYKKHVEDPFASLVEKHPELFRGGVILDVGANVGYTASVFARGVPDAHVYAFEPEPRNFERLTRVIRREGLKERITAVRTAVGAFDGETSLIVNPSHPGDHRVGSPAPGDAVIPVGLISLDSFARQEGLERVKFVKIDVQGYELEVSRGMEQLMARSPDLAVVFEVTAGGGDEVQEYYRQRGFTLRLVTHDGRLLEPAAGVMDRAMRSRGYVDMLATRERRPGQ